LDFHTTTAEQPNILITADKDNEVVRRFINSSAGSVTPRLEPILITF
jgi:predicted acetyltransferase